MNVIKISKILSNRTTIQLVSMVAGVAEQIQYIIKGWGLFGFTQLITWLQKNTAPLHNQLLSFYNFTPINKHIQNQTDSGYPIKPVSYSQLALQNHPVNLINDTTRKAALATYKSFVMNTRNTMLADNYECYAVNDCIISLVNQYIGILSCFSWLPAQQSTL